jgi:hypothetical protein
MTWWLLCFSEPEEQRVLGVVLVEGVNVREAVRRMCDLGIDPGGKLTSEEFPAGVAPPEPYRNRQLSYAEAQECQEEISRRYRAGRAA